MDEKYLTISRFEDHVCSDEKNNKAIIDRIGNLEREIGTKVSWVIFWSIVLLLIGIVGGMFGVLYGAIKNVEMTAQSTKESVSYIKGVLDKAEITK